MSFLPLERHNWQVSLLTVIRRPKNRSGVLDLSLLCLQPFCLDCLFFVESAVGECTVPPTCQPLLIMIFTLDFRFFWRGGTQSGFRTDRRRSFMFPRV